MKTKKAPLEIPQSETEKWFAAQNAKREAKLRRRQELREVFKVVGQALGWILLIACLGILVLGLLMWVDSCQQEYSKLKQDVRVLKEQNESLDSKFDSVIWYSKEITAHRILEASNSLYQTLSQQISNQQQYSMLLTNWACTSTNIVIADPPYYSVGIQFVTNSASTNVQIIAPDGKIWEMQKNW